MQSFRRFSAIVNETLASKRKFICIFLINISSQDQLRRLYVLAKEQNRVLWFSLWRAELKLFHFIYMAMHLNIHNVVTFIKEHIGVELKRNV